MNSMLYHVVCFSCLDFHCCNKGLRVHPNRNSGIYAKSGCLNNLMKPKQQAQCYVLYFFERQRIMKGTVVEFGQVYNYKLTNLLQGKAQPSCPHAASDRPLMFPFAAADSS
ncbi:hypothetical protein V6N11_022538 [Hibiscus sabdariffa]|uniref:Uncharacterized protein n=1 Tax=Hibiscus sabdariffa TaxID=183260 RepID=A0ABR2TJN2_9ROSI